MKLCGKLSVICLSCFLLFGCDNSDQKVEEHVWQAQEDALKKAKELEAKVSESLEEQREKIEETMGE